MFCWAFCELAILNNKKELSSDYKTCYSETPQVRTPFKSGHLLNQDNFHSPKSSNKTTCNVHQEVPLYMCTKNYTCTIDIQCTYIINSINIVVHVCVTQHVLYMQCTPEFVLFLCYKMCSCNLSMLHALNIYSKRLHYE